MKIPYPIERIEWLDHCSLGGPRGWREMSEAERLTPATVTTVGYRRSEDKVAVILISSIGENEIDGETCIVKSCIVSRKVLEPGAK